MRPRARNLWVAGLVLLLVSCGSPAERAAEAGAEAQQLLDAGQYGEAAARLDYAIRQRDDVPGLWLLLGRVKIVLRDAPGAYAAYRNALDQDPGSREALFALSQLSLAAGRYSDANDYAGRLLLLSPGEPNALVMQGFAELGMGRIADAGRTADKVLDREPANELGLTIKSMIAYRKGDYAAATAILSESFARGTTSLDVLRQLRRIYRRVADIRNLTKVAGRLAELQPTDEAAQLDLAKTLYAAGNVAEGGRVLANLTRDDGAARREAAIAIWMDAGVKPDALARDRNLQSRPWLQLSIAEFGLRRGRPDLALQILKSEAEASVTVGNVDRQGALAMALLAVGRRTEALTRSRAVLAVDPRQPAALLTRGRMALERQDADGALRDARMLISDNPSFVAGYALLAESYRLSGDMLLADRAIMDASSGARDSAEQIQYTFDFFSRRAKLEQVYSLFNEFNARNPISRTGWLLRSKVCFIESDQKCLARSSEFLGRLNGNSIDYRITPENNAATADEELFAS